MFSAHPKSPNYGKHWSARKVNDMFAPSRDTAAAVVDWLSSTGITKERIKQSLSKGWLALNATVQEAESLLHTTYHVYEDSSTGDTATACEA